MSRTILLKIKLSLSALKSINLSKHIQGQKFFRVKTGKNLIKIDLILTTLNSAITNLFKQLLC